MGHVRGHVSASSTILIYAEPARVLDAIADYREVRPRILSAHYRDYRVEQGGRGRGTVATWTLQATRSRARQVRAEVDLAGHTVIEKDANSSLLTNWTVAPAGPGASVTVTTRWTGAGGVGGFFERAFAPLGLRRIQAQVLGNLKREVEAAGSAGTPPRP
ncbi:MAG: SRPBCC family protein [Mycobacterium sp.]